MLKQYSFCFLTLLMLLTIQSCNKDQQTTPNFIPGTIEQINADSLKADAQWLQDMGTRFFLADNHRKIAERIRKRFVGWGYTNALLDSFYLSFNYKGTTYNSWQYNVIATLEGSGDSTCIMGSHYDDIVYSGDPFTYAPGANDNASGVSAVFEIARLIHKIPDKPRHTIKFIAFAAEEGGLYGSYDYAVKAKQKNEKIVMMLDNDMISVLSSPKTKPWYMNIINYSNSTKLFTDACNACSSYTSLSYINDNTNWNRSDSYPFYYFGYMPLIFTEASDDGNYHTVNDLVSTCNYEYCREMVKISYAMLLEKNYK